MRLSRSFGGVVLALSIGWAGTGPTRQVCAWSAFGGRVKAPALFSGERLKKVAWVITPAVKCRGHAGKLPVNGSVSAILVYEYHLWGREVATAEALSYKQIDQGLSCSDGRI